jgi:putative hydrolase of the HAD superfamily
MRFRPPLTVFGSRGGAAVIETFLFDMGNVLVHFSHELMCNQIGALCGRTGLEIRKLLFDSELQWKFERGFLSEAEFHRQVEELVAQQVDIAALVHAGSNIFQLNAPLVPILDALKARGHRLVVLSNTSISHFEFVQRHFDVLQKFDAYVLSYQVGAIKPEPAIFEAALQAIECRPENCFYTDDIPQYIEKGRSFGLQAEVFTDAQNLREQLRQRGIELS